MAVPAEPVFPSAAVFEPKTWVDLMTAHAIKGDMFSARTLMVIHEGVEKLVGARAAAQDWVTVTSVHTALFERLQRSFNNPNLLKEVGSVYLMEFRMPSIALKHFELARQLAPKDRDLEQLQTAASRKRSRRSTKPAPSCARRASWRRSSIRGRTSARRPATWA
jgi:hypothetical protein